MLTIGALASQTGVSCSALRYYESLGLLSVPHRVSGQRRYEATVVDRVQVIQVAQQAGFSLAEIKTLVDPGQDFSQQVREISRRKLEALEALMAAAKATRARLEAGTACGCGKLEDCQLFRADGTPQG